MNERDSHTDKISGATVPVYKMHTAAAQSSIRLTTTEATDNYTLMYSNGPTSYRTVLLNTIANPNGRYSRSSLRHPV